PPVGEEFFVGEEHEHGDDHFGGGDAAVVSGPAGGVADAFVPGDDDAAASGEHSVAGDEDFPVVGGAGAVAGGFPVTGFAVFVAVPHVAVVGDEDDGPVGAVRGVEEGAEFPDAVDPPGRGVAFPAGGEGVVDDVEDDGDDLFGVVDGRLDVGGQPVPGAGGEFPLVEEGAGAGSGGGFPPEGGESGAFVALPAGGEGAAQQGGPRAGGDGRQGGECSFPSPVAAGDFDELSAGGDVFPELHGDFGAHPVEQD